MSDNTTITAGVGTPIATDLVGGAHYQRVKPVWGADGVAVDVSAADPLPVTPEPSPLWVTGTAATGVALTLTLPAPGAGLFIYITYLEIVLYATAARTGSATPVVITSTGLTGSPAWTFPTAQAIGAVDRRADNFESPIKASTVNTAVTIVAPIATTGIWRMNVAYFTGP